MKKFILIYICLIIMVFSLSTMASTLTAEEIMNKRDDNEYIETAIVESEMIIKDARREMTKIMVSFIKENDGLTEFTNPRDRGTKFLKRGDDFWMFFPDAEDLVKISGHMLNQ